MYRIGYKPAVVLTSRRLKDFCGSLASVAYSEDCIDQISCPLHDAHPPSHTAPMMIPVPGCLSAVVHIGARLYHMAKTLGGLWAL